MLGLPTVYESNNPVNATLRTVALVCAGVFVVAVIVLQQHVRMMHEMTTSSASAESRQSETVVRPNIGPMEIESKLAVKIAALERRFADHDEVVPEPEPAPTSAARAATDAEAASADPDVQEALEGIDAMAVSRTQRLRAALVAGEFAGSAEALRRIRELLDEADPDGALAADANWFEMIYRGQRDQVTPEARAALIQRHGWYAELALTFGQPDHAVERWSVVGGGMKLVKFVAVFYLLMGLCFLIGTGWAIWGVLKFASGAMASAVGESADDKLIAPVYLETFALFAGGMTLFMLVAAAGVTVRDQAIAATLLAISEVITWSLVLVPLWPLARSVDRSVLLEDLGLDIERRAVPREILWGVAAWMAGMPLSILVGVLVEMVGSMFSSSSAGAEGSAATTPQSYPMFEPPLADSWLLVLLGVVGAVVWAPISEEIVFRGVLHRWLRPRIGPALTIAASSIAFGAVHPYSSAGLIQVAFGGLMYGVIREWRGSLVPSMVAHCLHNATISVTTVYMLMALGD